MKLLKRGCNYIVILILVLCIYGCKNSLDTSPRKPRYEVPITHSVGWWTHQGDLHIDSLSIEVVESKLNLFNAKSLIAYAISGNIFHKNGWKPEIEQIHIAEYFNKDSIHTDYDRVIEITPVVKISSNETLREGVKPFSLRNEYIINSDRWGPNRIKIICGDKEQIIELWQYK